MIRLVCSSLVLMLCVSGCVGPKYVARDSSLSQNWNEDDRKKFYQTSQGSQLLRYDWFLALEKPASEEMFLEDKLHRFGYLPDPFGSNEDYNPDNLPIGFVKDDDKGFIDGKPVDGPWVGMTCAACHTSKIHINDNAFLIDGGPTDADFYAFIYELSESLKATAKIDGKYTRFEERVGKRAGLRTDLKKAANRFYSYVQQSTPNPGLDPDKQQWGKARLDAVTLILNTVAFGQNPVDENVKLPVSPVSYPFLWDTAQQPHNQWNGVSVGALSRNTTEVLGVFATFEPGKLRKNSVQLGGLQDLQRLVVNLRSPKWEDQKFGLPPIDKTNWERGKILYKERCQTCHQVLDRDQDQVKRVPIRLDHVDEIETDRGMAVDFVTHRFVKADGEVVGSQKLIGDALKGVWFKSIFGGLIRGAIQEFIGGRNRINDDDVLGLSVYKGRPLNGAWSTAPYLHNGSVPNMYEMMISEEKRSKSFCVGSREFDPVKLGFKSDAKMGCGDNFKLITTDVGNSNKGHSGSKYGTDELEHEDILAIIEFIKAE